MGGGLMVDVVDKEIIANYLNVCTPKLRSVKKYWRCDLSCAIFLMCQFPQRLLVSSHHHYHYFHLTGQSSSSG